ncbi:hypothetical protein MXL46_07900 [Heyndrickxia sporothermodurans]|nr:hypothetical protein [Heyndrickxia sporothermodurans]MBL5767764.1 hypothetical protein [Heyndrickxia sporothermodurans]MBL5771270.1 hypothetical protein [Heyndrickxia sporothermodurans]MBL5775964.1 hypothetical protein [Heyndrickxia sporothermodurans]MBL5779452.1 hypothetical protein [Heyndrickxia sporothermodurans]MBL5785640.1 hypothetical protein [Heyndrickxia sporothermodurans]
MIIILEHQIEDMFIYSGYGHLYNHLKTPIEISGILSNTDPDVLEDFFDDFDFIEYDRLLFDEFRYFFSIYKNIRQQEKEQLIE